MIDDDLDHGFIIKSRVKKAPNIIDQLASNVFLPSKLNEMFFDGTLCESDYKEISSQLMDIQKHILDGISKL